MPNIIDLIAQDSKASEISSEIKDSLYAKAAEKIEALRSGVSKVMFDEPQVENETETENELETETEKETE
jgi:hypothetical protein|tara:strand:+ start:517 stop:726 length:210 start_codon:yes stop_codon:yes gene_type:complete